MSNSTNLLEVTIIVSIGEIPGYVYVAEDGNFIVVSDIKDCTKWYDTDLEEPCKILSKVRDIFSNLKFIAVRVPAVIFGTNPRRTRG